MKDIKKIKNFIFSDRFLVIFTVCCILLIVIPLIAELIQSSFKATHRAILLLLLLYWITVLFVRAFTIRKNILRKTQNFILSERFVVIFTICYILLLGALLKEELEQSSFRATDRVILLLLVFCIPILLIPAWIRIAGKVESIRISDIEIGLRKEITNKVATELVENITASTESTLYSLISFMIVEPKTVSNYIQEARGDSNQIIVGCQDYTEQRILCAIITKLLKEKRPDLDVIPKYNFGGAGLNFIALSRGDIDIYPAYTWQGFEMVYGTYLSQKRKLLIKGEPNRDEAEERIQDLNSLYNGLSIPLRWICYTGFYNNWNMIVREDYAKENAISDVSNLEARINKNLNLRLACEYDFFARPNGYKLLTSPKPDGYGIHFEKVTLIKHEDAYKALNNEEVDVIDGFATDPEKDEKNEDGKQLYRQLNDDRAIFGRYYSSILAREEILALDNVQEALEALKHKIKTQDISDMIYEANQYSSIDTEKIEEIAKKFLKKNALLDL